MRTFLALDIDAETRKALASLPGNVPAAGAKIRWTEPENLHVTLHFLGEVDAERLTEVCETAVAGAGEVEPFDFAVEGALCVPSGGRKLRMIWAGVVEPTGRLAALHTTLGTALEGLGFRQERRAFRPHITLARLKYANRVEPIRRAVAGYSETRFGTPRADAATIYTSELTPRGAVYTPAARVPLGV
ncbi:MAG: RNA 2',3'-cyclic phosphodiesterase [Phycisphaerae bacterium]|nr:RNA 2',3'-cyclic phosphodiesterase [Phycisphaerae bacterium]